MYKFLFFLTILSITGISLLSNIRINTKPLGGDIPKTEDIVFEPKKFFTGEFQDQKAKFINENSSIYPLWVRLNNQLIYWIFQKTNAFHVVYGKNQNLFDESYISAYLGLDYIGDETIETKTNQLLLLKKTLNYYGKDLLVCLVPGKASFYYDDFPSKFQDKPIAKTNYNVYLNRLKNKGIGVFDYRNFLLSYSDTSKFNLYPKQGIHLSTFGTTILAKQLISDIGSLYQKEIPEILINKITQSQESQFYDRDIYQSINLLFDWKPETLAYPQFSFSRSSNTLKVLTVGDSFYKYIYDSGIHTQAFNNGAFWFYGKKVWPLSTELDVSQLDIRAEVLGSDIIMVFASEATMYLFPYGIDELIMNKLLPPDDDIMYNFFKNKINFDSIWKKSIEEKASVNQLSFDKQIDADIRYLISEYIRNADDKTKALYQLIKQMKSDPVWFEAVKNKSQANGIDLNRMMYLDAEYIYETKK